MIHKNKKDFPKNRGFLVCGLYDGFEVVWFDEDNGKLYVGMDNFNPDDFDYWMELPDYPY